MRAVVQRVKEASVQVNNEIVGQIKAGLLVLVGIGKEDQKSDIEWLANKITGLRIFEDDLGKMNLSVGDIEGEVLLISQFTLFGDCRKGKRPSFSEAAAPEEAKLIFEDLIRTMESNDLKVETGIFQADMDVKLLNWGPVTILLDSQKLF